MVIKELTDTNTNIDINKLKLREFGILYLKQKKTTFKNKTDEHIKKN